MDKEKARAVLSEALQPYRARSYAELRDLIGQVDVCEIVNSDGPDFQIEIQAFWDDKPNGNICVSGGIDDGGWSAFAPLGEDFILAPDGSFVAE
ncbi:MAG: hypothetical protein QF578_21960 [Alphaproteobacteria bacterium]|nr:hypothetical protein [Alphaproteobacteria bacterium]MDP6567511.1 hypothetical protein [Alphaproteobacteria bacterium]MDP6813328.1 hypothetical protein [Alphaproteobacteria bacterium]